MGRRFWIILGFILLIGLAVFVFLIWRKQAENRKTLSEELAIGGKVQQSQQPIGEPRKEPERVLAGNNLVIEKSKGLEFKPFFKEEGEKIKETFLERFSALAIPAEVLISTPEERSKALLEIPKPAPKKTLTDEEWFKIVYPKPVLDSLPVIEEAMRFTGFISQSEKFEFTSDEKIRAFWHKAIEWALKENMIDEKQAKGFRNGIDVVIPSLQEQEKRQYEQNLSAYLLNLIFAKLTKTAFAQSECYREGSSSGSGYNTWAMCCNCGYYQKGKVFIWYNDCDYGYCNVDLGCKNLMCESGPMIYDDASGICGCG